MSVVTDVAKYIRSYQRDHGGDYPKEVTLPRCALPEFAMEISYGMYIGNKDVNQVMEAIEAGTGRFMGVSVRVVP